MAHYRKNLDRDWQIPWSSGTELTSGEKQRIAASVAEFQRGESSEAQDYLAKSTAFSTAARDRDFHEASILFVAEENAHAALLLRFMRETAIPTRKHSFSDGVFRWLRSIGDLGWSSRVLLIAELIAQDYYPCLRAATTHPALQRICDKIEYDEKAHVRFQTERIARLEAGRSDLAVGLRRGLQSLLLCGAIVVVYLAHRPVLRTRLRFAEFVTTVLRRNRHAQKAISAHRGRLRADAVPSASCAAAFLLGGVELDIRRRRRRPSGLVPPREGAF
ncbi:hypothetical protein ACRS6B_14530 [Nocardia asteroides]